MKVSKFMARQYSQPSGVIGRVFIAPLLNRVNAGSNSAVFQALALRPDSRVLEIGFGGGDLLFRIASTVKDEITHGLELSTAMVSRAESRAESQAIRNRLQFDQGTVDTLPYRDGQFNRVCSVNTVYFWADLEESFTEIARITEPGGLLVLGFGSHLSMKDAGYDAHTFFLHTPEDISRALASTGFTRENLETLHRNKRGAFHVSSSIRSG